MSNSTQEEGASMLDTAIVPAPAVAADGESLAAHLFERHHVEVFAYLVRMVHDREWAQDLAQETFVQAYRHRDRLAGLHNPRAWLYRVATNLTLNALRRRRRFAWLPWEWHEGQTHAPDPTEAVSRQAQVEAALASLSPDQRAALLLYAHYGLRIAEIAEVLNLTEGAARMRLQRAREQFRLAYRKEDVR